MPSETSRPNIVFILTDQWRGDCLSALGHPVVETPNLDALARRGTLFTASYASVPSCIAARASLFTGLRPTTHGRLGYQDGVPWRYETSLPGELSRAGYQTHCVGKTHFFPQRLHFGFHSLDSYEAGQNFDGRYVNDYREWLRDRTGGRMRETDHGLPFNSWIARPSHLPEELHVNTWTVTRSEEFLRRRDRTRPFFLNVSFHRPHPPVDPPRVYFDLYKDRDLPPAVGAWAKDHAVPVTDASQWHGDFSPRAMRLCRQAYFAQIAHIDNQIGRLVEAVRGHGPTWFLFTSDHGEMLGDHNHFRKTYPFEGSARTPFLLCPPEESAIHVSEAPVAQEDLMPTLLEAAGAPIPSCVEGRSLVPLLSAPPETVGWREWMHGEHSACYHPDSGVQYITDGKEKYAWYTATGEEHFFDLREDPEERRDLAVEPAAAERLELWRSRMVEELAPREQDGLTDGKRLVPGTRLPATRPELLEA